VSASDINAVIFIRRRKASPLHACWIVRGLREVVPRAAGFLSFLSLLSVLSLLCPFSFSFFKRSVSWLVG
jgi:hypothetical protein